MFLYNTHLMIITIFIVIKAGFMGKVKSIIHVFFAFKFLFFCQKQKKFFHLRLSGSVFITQSLSHLPGKSLFTSIKHRIGTYRIPNFFSFLPFSVKNWLSLSSTHTYSNPLHTFINWCHFLVFSFLIIFLAFLCF